MLVRFLKDWQGSKVGDEIEIIDSFAQGDLIPRGIAEAVKADTEQELIELREKVKSQAEELAKMKAAPHDKMVRGAANK